MNQKFLLLQKGEKFKLNVKYDYHQHCVTKYKLYFGLLRSDMCHDTLVNQVKTEKDSIILK